MSSDLATLQTIFASRFPAPFLEAVLQSHGSLPQACDYLSTLDDTEIPTESLQETFSSILPRLTRVLSTTPIPDITGTTDRLSYTLSDLRITSVNLPQEKLSVVEGDTVEVAIGGASVSAEGTWAYRLRVPRLRDDGDGKFSCSGVSAVVILTPEGEVLECSVSVGEVAFRATNARFSWLYNTLAGVTRPAMRRAVEDALEGALRDASADWQRWA